MVFIIIIFQMMESVLIQHKPCSAYYKGVCRNQGLHITTSDESKKMEKATHDFSIPVGR